MDTIGSRRSIRKYKPDEVSRDLIEQIAEAARLAPSAKNRQPWRFIVYTGAQKERLLDVMQQALQKEQQTHALLPESAGGLPDAFNTLKIMRTALRHALRRCGDTGYASESDRSGTWHALDS